jgi:ferredoxin
MPERATATGVRIAVDRALCFGFGDCVDTAPTVFALDGEQIAIVIDAAGAPLELVVEAAQNCPVDAIVIADEHGQQLYP